MIGLRGAVSTQVHPAVDASPSGPPGPDLGAHRHLPDRVVAPLEDLDVPRGVALGASSSMRSSMASGGARSVSKRTRSTCGPLRTVSVQVAAISPMMALRA